MEPAPRLEQGETELLRDLRAGSGQAFDRLMTLLYDRLRAMAHRQMPSERPEHTLRTTALVHEACVRMLGADIPWQDRTHFLAVASKAMRRVLVDYARSRNREKRGPEAGRVSLEEALVISPEPTADLVLLDEALTRLTSLDARKAEVVELIFFGGLSYEEAAQCVGVSRASLHRELRMAKAWLYHELSPGDA